MNYTCFFFIISILIFARLLQMLLSFPKIKKCPNCNDRIGGICNFNILNYLVQNSEIESIVSQYIIRKDIYHKIAQILLILILIGILILLPIVKFILGYNLLLFSHGIIILFFITLFFYFLGVKCPVCGHINSSGAEKHCTNCGVKLE